MIGGKFVVGVLAGMLVMTSFAFTASAAAAPVPGTLAAKVPVGSVFDPVFDGTDVYWVDERERVTPRDDFVDTRVLKQPLSGGSTVTLAQVSGRTYDTITDVKAGGGVVAYVREHNDLDKTGARTEVVRIAAGGSGETVIATGEMTHPEIRGTWGRPEVGLFDCGTKVSLSDVSPQGEVIIATMVRNRTGGGCGGTENSNVWTFHGVRPDGSTRVITSVRASVRQRVKRKRGRVVSARCDCDRGWRRVEVNGDWALVSRSGYFASARSRLINLTTGMFTGPYLVDGLDRSAIVFESFDRNGRFAVSGVQAIPNRKRKGKRRTYRPRFRSVIFPAAGSTSPQVRVAGAWFAQYCGDRLIGFRGDTRSFTLDEFEPGTGAHIRTLGDMPNSSIWSYEFCSSTHVYMIRANEHLQTTRFLAMPLA